MCWRGWNGTGVRLFARARVSAFAGARRVVFEFERRYPWPVSEALVLDPAYLAECDPHFTVTEHEKFEIGIALECEFYIDYMMTETNVAAAIRQGTAEDEIRDVVRRHAPRSVP